MVMAGSGAASKCRDLPARRAQLSGIASVIVCGFVCWALVREWEENQTCQFRACVGKSLLHAHHVEPSVLNVSVSEGANSNASSGAASAVALTQDKRPSAQLLNETAARVVILIPASAAAQGDTLWATWARDAHNVHLVGPCANCTFQTDHELDWFSLPGKVLQMFQTAASIFPEAELFVKADMDTYVFVENLLWSLLRHKAAHGSWPDYVGSVYEYNDPYGRNVRYCSGGAGYVVSRQVVQRFLDPHYCGGPFVPPFEDVAVGRCLARGGILPLHSPGFLGDKVEDALKHWLDTPIYKNHVGDPSVPAALITVHGYKDPYMLKAIDLLSRARQLPPPSALD
jgi:hypothetical protein